MYKLFVNNKEIYLTSHADSVERLLKSKKDVIVKSYKSKEALHQFIKSVIYNANFNTTIILHSIRLQVLYKDFLKFFKKIEAAGGVVINPKEEVLLIFRRGSWDLPKGKIDDGETVQDAAIREIQEETGVGNLKIVKPIIFKKTHNSATYHAYSMNGKKNMKITYWFLMHTTDTKKLKPQTDEDIEQAVWVPKAKLKDYYSNMYASIKDVLMEL
ncbi:MAG: NUDIX domain-containing protein [Chitinophagales bacterium]|nr:NUDIX domain-containing protein [Chitinophagales bacterium]